MSWQRRHGLLFALPLLVVLAAGLLAIACAGIASPEGWASPVTEGDLLLAANEDELFALDPETLDPLWAFPNDAVEQAVEGDVDVEALYGTPAVVGDTVLVPAYDGFLYALGGESGELVWKEPFDTGGPLIGGVVASDRTVYFGSDDGKVYAVDIESGEPAWNEPFATGEKVWSRPTLAGDVLYVTSLDRRLYALDAASGQELWQFKTGAGIGSPAVVSEAGDLVYVGGFDNELRAIDVETREERWSLKTDNWFWTEPLVAEGVVYAGNLEQKVYAVNGESGELVWPSPFETEGLVRAAPVLVGGVLIIVDKDGNVYGIDPREGIAAMDGPLALGGDVLSDPILLPRAGEEGEDVVVVTTDGELVRIDPETLTVVDRRRLVE
ncbi:MAG: PQQ-binding-like beta-propeller repeat protein [Dehalococcoidia bacterium]|nr:PQQ-binding-like beta-propeller repeat protein [Dehalococcoidia bacterium]